MRFPASRPRPYPRPSAAKALICKPPGSARTLPGAARATPTISFDHQSPAPNASGWNNTAISDYWNCADSLSGPASASVSETLGSEGADQSLTGTCTDLAGNTATETQSHIKIDLTNPVITF